MRAMRTATHSRTWEQGAWTDDSVGPLDAKLKRRRVRLTGLQRDELNGREGTIVDLLKHRGRYAVLVDGGEVVNVLPSKVELIPGEMEAATEPGRGWRRRRRPRRRASTATTPRQTPPPWQVAEV